MIRRFSGCEILPVHLLRVSCAGAQALDACFSSPSAEWTVGSVLRPTSSGEGSIMTGIVASVGGGILVGLALCWEPPGQQLILPAKECPWGG